MTQIRDYNNKLIQINKKDNLIILRIGKEIVMLNKELFEDLTNAINLEIEIGLNNNDN
jgi:hypothetical protein